MAAAFGESQERWDSGERILKDVGLDLEEKKVRNFFGEGERVACDAAAPAERYRVG